MPTILKQTDWELVKVNGEFYSVTPDENRRLIHLNRQYLGFENAPDSELFVAYGLISNSDGHLFCNGLLDRQLRPRMILSDNETKIDLLNSEAIAATIVDLITERPDHPITIGVHGDWGAGKSSVLEMIEAGLSDQKDV